MDDRLTKAGSGPVHLLVGGAGAIIGAYGYSDTTTDVDAIPLNTSFDDLRPILDEVAKEFGLQSDWLNPHFQMFTTYLPQDYRKRCIPFFRGSTLHATALGAEELLIMKLMAGRFKDNSHILFLLKKNPDLRIIQDQLTHLVKIWPKLANAALDRFDELTEET